MQNSGGAEPPFRKGIKDRPPPAAAVIPEKAVLDIDRLVSQSLLGKFRGIFFIGRAPRRENREQLQAGGPFPLPPLLPPDSDPVA